MNTRIRIAIIAVSLSMATSVAAEDEDLTVQEILATSKIAGACGILNSLVQFQSATKMQGGDEFVVRFWSVEAARLGITVDQLSHRCDRAVSIYDSLWSAADGAAVEE